MMYTVDNKTIENIWNYLIYLRKSRSDSPLETVEEVLEKHERQLQDYAMRTFGEHIPEENIFREIVSGETIADRPEMMKVLSRIESSNIEGVIVVEPQRLSRGDLVDCGNIIRAFKYTDTKILTPVKSYDLHDRFDEKFFKDELMRGADFLEYTKEIMGRGRLQSVADGWFVASTPPYGYDKIKVRVGHKDKPTLKINEDEANVVKMVFDMYVNQNMSPWSVARNLNEMGIKSRKGKNFTDHTIMQILQNLHYIGKVVWNQHKTETNYVDGKLVKSRPKNKDFLVFEGRHPALISEELFNAAKERLGRNPRVTPGRELVNPLARLMYCQCGYAMSYRKMVARGVETAPPRLLCHHQQFCHTRSVTFKRALDAVISGLEQHLEDFEVKLKNGDGESAILKEERLSHIQKELDEIEKQQEKLYDFLERGIYDEDTFVKRNKALMEKREELRSAYNKITATLPMSVNYEDKIVKLSQAIEALKDDALSAKVKNDFLTAIVDKIVYTSIIYEHGHVGGKWERADFTLDIFLRV